MIVHRRLFALNEAGCPLRRHPGGEAMLESVRPQGYPEAANPQRETTWRLGRTTQASTDRLQIGFA